MSNEDKQVTVEVIRILICLVIGYSIGCAIGLDKPCNHEICNKTRNYIFRTQSNTVDKHSECSKSEKVFLKIRSIKYV